MCILSYGAPIGINTVAKVHVDTQWCTSRGILAFGVPDKKKAALLKKNGNG